MSAWPSAVGVGVGVGVGDPQASLTMPGRLKAGVLQDSTLFVNLASEVTLDSYVLPRTTARSKTDWYAQ